jgi:GT2 family glycosyltransferase
VSDVPKISVIIPNLNSPIIDQTLAALRQQQYDLSQVEVLVVGLDGPGLVERDDLVRLISTHAPVGPAAARNIGIREARGDLLCFTDADCIPASDWLVQLTTPLLVESVDVVCGGVDFEAGNYWTLCDNLSWFHDYLVSSQAGERELLPTLNLCMKRNVIEKTGFLNENYPKAAGEDAEWTVRMRRAGFGLHFVPRAVVRHRSTRASLKDTWRHAYTYGRYSARVNPEFADFLHTPIIFRKWWALLLLSPVISVVAMVRIYFHDPALWRYWYTGPGILLSKVAWILGASRTLRGPAQVLQPHRPGSET